MTPMPGVFLGAKDCGQIYDDLLGICYSLSINTIGGNTAYPPFTAAHLRRLEAYRDYFGTLGQPVDGDENPWPELALP